MKMVWPNISLSLAATKRVMASVPVPAWLPTIILMGLLGQLAVCAFAMDAIESTKTRLIQVQAVRDEKNIKVSCRVVVLKMTFRHFSLILRGQNSLGGNPS